MVGNAVEVMLVGLGAGVLVGLMGVGGGIVVVPLLVHYFGFEQHLAQGTSIFLQLPPIGLGALREYWKSGDVDVPAGVACAGGALVGGYGGSLLALILTGRHLRAMFGAFLLLAAVLMARQALAAPRRTKTASAGNGAGR
ncbi:MAG TPA: TSUP family transporter [Candidatus Acidoferrales bacterium]|nr:TSUP family transporter [Candidatus Acidoferrales bacterium]